MPIYAYKCASCGHAKDVLQKISDAPLTTCPACGAEAFSKQLTAAGFQLKGSGWYVTDFRDGNKAASKAASPDGAKDTDQGNAASAESSGAPADKAADKSAASAAPAASAPAAAAAPSPAAAPSSS